MNPLIVLCILILFILNGCSGDALLELDGIALKEGSSFRMGHYDVLNIEDAVVWNDVLVVWIMHKADKPVNIKLLQN